jgi:hypothetical protein
LLRKDGISQIDKFPETSMTARRLPAGFRLMSVIILYKSRREVGSGGGGVVAG